MSRPSGGRAFAARIVAWQRRHGRHDLPWQGGDPYRVWIAETMLQQTQVATVIPYFERFCRRFPDLRTLADAPLHDVLAQWAGLGYYARARNLHACARTVAERHGGRLPLQAAALVRLPGIGRSTAGAIAAFCAGAREPILDGNVRRVLTRHFMVDGDAGRASVQRRLWELAAALLPPAADMPAYTQGLMDLGATVCTWREPPCGECPVRSTCAARRAARIADFPGRPARKALPERRAWALLALHDGRVLLERRAPAGVWGGLLALPQFDSLSALRRAAAGVDARPRLRALSSRRLLFTHFALTLRPHRLDVRAPAPAVRDDDEVWLPLAELAGAPLPAPVLALLREVAAGAAPADRSCAGRPGARRSVQVPSSGVMPSATRKRDTRL